MWRYMTRIVLLICCICHEAEWKFIKWCSWWHNSIILGHHVSMTATSVWVTAALWVWSLLGQRRGRDSSRAKGNRGKAWLGEGGLVLTPLSPPPARVQDLVWNVARFLCLTRSREGRIQMATCGQHAGQRAVACRENHESLKAESTSHSFGLSR